MANRQRANVYMRTVASRNAIIERMHAGNDNLRRGAGQVPVLAQKKQTTPVPRASTWFVLHVRLCDRARVVVSSDGVTVPKRSR